MNPKLKTYYLLLVLLAASVIAVGLESPTTGYRSNDELLDGLYLLAASYSHLATVYSIGHSNRETELRVIKISCPNLPVGTPHVKLIGGIHGNEPVGREVLYSFVEELLVQYVTNYEVQRLLNTTHIHILPAMNPDGFAVAQEGVCEEGPGRLNDNGVDLDKNFPSGTQGNEVTTKVQHETRAVMNWMKKYPFVLSASIHSGSVLVSYPYSRPHKSGMKGSEHRTLDNSLFRSIALDYSKSHGYMADMKECKNEARSASDGIVNGATWKPVYGSMQDYNYDFHSCLEIALGLNCCKYPDSSEITKIYTDNKKALMDFAKHSHLGVKGVVKNGTVPVQNATVFISGYKSHLTTEKGEYWILLLPGRYKLRVEKSGFDSEIRTVTVDRNPHKNPSIEDVDLAISKKVTQTEAVSTHPTTFPDESSTHRYEAKLSTLVQWNAATNDNNEARSNSRTEALTYLLYVSMLINFVVL